MPRYPTDARDQTESATSTRQLEGTGSLTDSNALALLPPETEYRQVEPL